MSQQLGERSRQLATIEEDFNQLKSTCMLHDGIVIQKENEIDRLKNEISSLMRNLNLLKDQSVQKDNNYIATIAALTTNVDNLKLKNKELELECQFSKEQLDQIEESISERLQAYENQERKYQELLMQCEQENKSL